MKCGICLALKYEAAFVHLEAVNFFAMPLWIIALQKTWVWPFSGNPAKRAVPTFSAQKFIIS
jgi:hypothetical protein